jgi:hypothetical protein
MYYVFSSKPIGSAEPLASIEDAPEIPGIESWLSGNKFKENIPEPIEIYLDDNYPGRMPDFFNFTIPLMSDRLVDSLHEIGVSNFDTYRVIIKNGDGLLVSENYKAVNIIGIVAAADVNKSKVALNKEVGLIDSDFDSLEIDEIKAINMLMFRLAEAVSAIVIHERVKKHLENSGLGSLGFIEPKDWMC